MIVVAILKCHPLETIGKSYMYSPALDYLIDGWINSCIYLAHLCECTK